MITWLIDPRKIIVMVYVKSVRIIMTNGATFKDAIIEMPTMADPQTYIATLDMNELWASGSAVGPETFFAVQETILRDFYWNIQSIAKMSDILNKTADQTLGDLLTAMSLSPEKNAEFLRWMTRFGITTTPTTDIERQILILALMVFVSWGFNATL